MPSEQTSTDLSDQDAAREVEMCCDSSGRTAEEHRAESLDHKCCIDP